MQIVWLCAGFGILAVSLAAAFYFVKKALFSHMVSVVASTSTDEKVSFSVNFSIFDTDASMKKKLDQVCNLADTRRKEAFEAFEAHLEQVRAEQAAEAEAAKTH